MAITYTTVSKNSNKVNHVDIWHRRLGHPNVKVLSHVAKSSQLFTCVNKQVSLCETCQFGKKCHDVYPRSNSKSTAPLQLVFANV